MSLAEQAATNGVYLNSHPSAQIVLPPIRYTLPTNRETTKSVKQRAADELALIETKIKEVDQEMAELKQRRAELCDLMRAGDQPIQG